MIRNVVAVNLREDADPARVAEVVAGLRRLSLPGMVSYTVGLDARLREGNWSLAIVGDFEDVEAYRRYDADPEHNRLRDQIAPLTATIARVQFEL